MVVTGPGASLIPAENIPLLTVITLVALLLRASDTVVQDQLV